MKTSIAIAKAAELAAAHRLAESQFREKAHRPHVQDPELTRRYLGFAKREQRAAETYEQLAKAAQQLHSELKKVSGMLHYCVFAPPSGIELNKDDIRNVKAQIKVSNYLIKTHKP